MIHRLLDVLVLQVEPDRFHLEQERELAVDADGQIAIRAADGVSP